MRGAFPGGAVGTLSFSLEETMHDLDRSFLELEPAHAAPPPVWGAPPLARETAFVAAPPPFAREVPAVPGVAPSPFARELAAVPGTAPSPFAREIAAAGAPAPFTRELAPGRTQNQGVFDEMTEMELASELLGARSDHELDHFLGGLLGKAEGFLGKALHSSVGQEILGGLKDLARKALPAAGAALGNYLVPGVGGNIGRMLAQDAGKALGLELEGMSPADQEFMLARRVVRTAGRATHHAAGYVPLSHADARRVGQGAVAAAAQSEFPALSHQALAGLGGSAGVGGAGTGTVVPLGSTAGLADALGGRRSGSFVLRDDGVLLIPG
jgi:hypothetical protein